MKQLLFCCFLLISLSSFAQTKEYTVCEGGSFNVTPECVQGTGVSEGTVDTKTPGKYFIRQWCIDGTDTLARDSFYVNVEALPAVMLSPHSKTVCTKDSAFAISAIPAGGVFYTLGNQDVLDSNYFYPDRAEPGSHKIVYRYKSSSGCINTDTAAITVNDCTSGIFEPAIPQLSMYPNPARNYVEIKGDISHVSSVTLTSILGQETPVQLSANRISLDDIPPGLFQVKVTQYGRVFTFKGVKLP
jgi:hypothetical protein